MRIVVHIGVKDEVELIDMAIAHLRAIGIEQIIVSDMGSSDGTRDVLEYHRMDGVRILDRSDGAGALDDWAKVTLAAVQDVGADWAIFIDADEFLIPATGRIEDCRALGVHELVRLDRFNVPLAATGPLMPTILAPVNHDHLWLLVEPVPAFRQHLLQAPDTPWIRGVPMPKVMVRPDRVGTLAIGAHDAIGVDGAPLRETAAPDLVIAHVPFTTATRFRTKLANVRRTLAENEEFFAGLAWHWKRWVEIADRDGPDVEFDRQRMDATAIAAFKESGVIRSAAALFEQRAAASPKSHNGG